MLCAKNTIIYKYIFKLAHLRKSKHANKHTITQHQKKQDLAVKEIWRKSEHIVWRCCNRCEGSSRVNGKNEPGEWVRARAPSLKGWGDLSGWGCHFLQVCVGTKSESLLLTDTFSEGRSCSYRVTWRSLVVRVLDCRVENYSVQQKMVSDKSGSMEAVSDSLLSNLSDL